MNDLNIAYSEMNGEYQLSFESDTDVLQKNSTTESSSITKRNAYVPVESHSEFLREQSVAMPSVSKTTTDPRIQVAAQKSIIAIQQKECFADIELHKIESAEKIRADIASKKSLQHFEILTGKSGEIFFRRQLFTEKIENRFPFSLPSAAFLVNAENQAEMVLRIKCRRNDGCDILIFLNPARISQSSYLLRKFREKGMGLPFNRKKEIELLDCFLDFLLSFPIPKEICNAHLGWHIREGHLLYETQSQNLWKEVIRYAS
ncbi:MAG: hypothetical protein HFG76_01400 [Hungatella sp.]|nr:hypothetical protein [Hungatella sp.]